MTSGLRGYRSRRCRPCDSCRAKKTYCHLDGAPPCRLCRQQNRQCTFVFGPIRKTTRQKIKSIRNEEIPEVPGNPFALELCPPTADSSLQDILTARIPDTGISNLELQAQSAFIHPEDKLSLSKKPNKSHQLCGWTGESCPHLLGCYSYDDVDEHKFNKVSFRKISENPPVYFMLTDKELTRSLFGDERDQNKLLRAQLEQLVPFEEGRHFVQLFFRYVHPSIPVLCQTATLEDLYSIPTGILAAMYLLALPFTLFEPKIASHSYSAYQPPSSKELFDIGCRCYNLQSHTPDISTAQIALLLLQTEPLYPYFSDTAFISQFVSSLYSISQTLGLNVDCSGWNIPAWEKKIRKRVWWSVYCTEKWQSFVCGRSSHINDDDWDIAMFTKDDFETPLNYHFLILCSLSLILSDSLCQMYSLRAVKKRLVDVEGSLQLTKDLIARVRNLYRTFEPHIQMDHVKPATLTVTGSLFLCFLGLELALVKSYVEISSYDIDNKCTATPKYMATKLLNFMRSLKVEHTKAFWYSWCHQIFSSASSFFAFFALSPTSLDADFDFKSSLDDWRSLLQIHAGSFSPVRLGLGRLDGWVGLEKLSSSPGTSNH